MAKPAILLFGRFNPPTIGHERLFRTALADPSRSDVILFVSQSRDRKNPLTYEEKVQIIRSVLPSIKIGPMTARTPLTALDWVFSKGYRDIRVLVGDDRLEAFENLATGWKSFSPDRKSVTITVDSLPRNAEMSSDKVSGTTARKYALEGNFKQFQSILMGGTKNPALAKDTMKKIQDRLSVRSKSRTKTEEIDATLIDHIVEMILTTETIGDLYDPDNPGARPISDTDTRVPEDTENNKSVLVLYPERRLKYSMIEKLKQKRDQEAWKRKYAEWDASSRTNTK
jgi:hypothetical protein